MIDVKLYEALINFEDSEEAQDYYYQSMDKLTGKYAKIPLWKTC